MRPWWKLALSAVMFWLAFWGGPNEAEAVCANDTYCQFYTDDTFSVLCGERNQCINCSSVTEGWGCVGSLYRWCEVYGACGSSASCYRCTHISCYYYACPPA